MAELIAIGYPNENTAEEAAKEVQRLTEELIIEPDAVAVIKRDATGEFHVITNQNEVASGAVWGMFWGLLFGLLFFIPLLGLGLGAGLGALMGALCKYGGTVLKSPLPSNVESQIQEALHSAPVPADH